MALKQSEQSKREVTDKVGELLRQALTLMWMAKPEDRSKEDREWAIAITDMQKLIAFFNTYLHKPALYVARGRSKGELHILGIKASQEEAYAVCDKWKEFYENTYVEKWYVGNEVGDDIEP